MRLTLLCLLALLGSSCGNLSGGAMHSSRPSNCTALIDWADVLRYDGITYGAVPMYPNVGRAITDADIGAERFRVMNTVSLSTCDPYYRSVDGDAAFVPVGEPVFIVKGHAPTFRLAARHNGRLVLYEAESNPAAVRGADLLDIEGKVKSIGLFDQKTGRSVVARLTDPARVKDLVSVIARANIDQTYRPSPSAGASDFVQLAFELNDGTVSVRGYDRISGVLWRGIKVGPALTTVVDELVRIAPTPSPVPATINPARRYDLARATSVTIKDPSVGAGRASTSPGPFVAILDAELPARRATRPSGNYTVLIFNFPDHFVSFGYDEGTDTLTIALPDDEFAVSVPREFRALVR